MNEIERIDSANVMDLMQMATMNISNLGQQMGIVQKQIGSINTRMDVIEGRMQKYEDSTVVNRDEARRIKTAVHARVNKILHINYVDGAITPDSLFADKYYRPGFLARCYSDARKFSRLGTPYYTTLRRDLETCIAYIEKWQPELAFDGCVGEDALKRYLDARRMV